MRHDLVALQGVPKSRQRRRSRYDWVSLVAMAVSEAGMVTRTVAWSAIGATMLLMPVVYPSPHLAGPVWLGFIFFLLDPFKARAGAKSILGDLSAGRPDRFVNLAADGLPCGLIGDLGKYGARAKWIYTVPVLPNVKLFETPILGSGGFRAFAVECFVMYLAVRRLAWSGASRPIAL